MGTELNLVKSEIKFIQDNRRVITRFYLPHGEGRIEKIIQKTLSLPEKRVKEILKHVSEDFSSRHKNIWAILDEHFNNVRRYLPKGVEVSKERKALIGAYFTHEYSIQAAAFFNPSIVAHPDQTNLEDGSLRCIVSFRSTGEGHISSVEFRSGVIDKYNNFDFQDVSRFVEPPKIIPDKVYDRHTFRLKLAELEEPNNISDNIFSNLPESFTYADLQTSIRDKLMIEQLTHPAFYQTIENILWIANSNYEVKFKKESNLSERVIFPSSENESKGIEDARFVRFVDDDGDVTYYATYTAYNGHTILPQLMTTKDFLRFKVITLNGKAVKDKGMALFPRKINGKYMMLSRQDGESIYIMSSDNIHFWHEAELLREPSAPWEFTQIGNCGSPIETDEGWIVLTHGVGPMRQYCIGAMLLDIEEPRRIIGILPEPILSPDKEEREGYVPNVVYTCGAILHNDTLIIPYAMSDTTSGIACLSARELIDRIKSRSKIAAAC